MYVDYMRKRRIIGDLKKEKRKNYVRS